MKRQSYFLAVLELSLQKPFKAGVGYILEPEFWGLGNWMVRVAAVMIPGACVFTDLFVCMNENYTCIMPVLFLI